MKHRVWFTAGALAVTVAIGTGCSDSEQAKREHFENANRFMQAGNTQEAIVEYRNAIQQDGRYGEARLKLAEAYEKVGNLNQAAREYVRAADLLPQNNDAQVKAARYLIRAGRFEDARTRIQPVIDRDPTNVDAQLILGNALVGLKDLDGAATEIENAIKLDPDRATTYGSLAAVRQAQGQTAAAKAAYEKAVEVEPRSVPARLALAFFRWNSNESALAEETFKQAVEIDPKNSLANRLMATYYIATRRAPQAEPYLKQLVANGVPRASLQLADYYIGMRRAAEASTVLQPLTKDATLASAAETRLAAIAYGSNDAAKAHAMLDAVIKREPTNLEALLSKSRWLLREGKTQDALGVAQTAVKSNPESDQAHFVLAQAHERLLRRPEAIAEYTEVLRLNPRAVGAQLNLSRLSLYEGSPDRAVTFAEAALTNSPENPAARASLAQGLLAKGDTSRAEQEIAVLLKRYPQEARVHALNAALKVQRRDLNGARAEFDRALTLSPNLLEAVVGLTRLDIAQNRLPDARQRVESRLASDPNNAAFLLLAGDVYRRGRDFPKAEAALRKAVQVQPGLSQGYAMLGEVLVVSGKLDAARAEFDAMAKRDPKNIAAQTMAAMIVHGQGNIAEATKRYEAIVAADQSAVVALNNLAWIYAESGEKLEDALRHAQAAVSRMPDNAEVQDTLGFIHLKRELPALAIPAFEKSIEKAPENPLYHYHLALAQDKAGNAAAARQAAQQALKLKPGYAEAQQLLAKTKG